MINRTYVVKTPSTGRSSSGYVDICVQSNVGSRSLPVADPINYGAGNVTAPPSGWVAVCGDAAYYEIRGRELRLEHLAAAGVAGGFTPRTNLGFRLAITPYGTTAVQTITASATLSTSLLTQVGGDTGNVIASITLADPSYGPVIRIYAPQNGGGLLTRTLLVHFDIMERKDDDYCNVGSP